MLFLYRPDESINTNKCLYTQAENSTLGIDIYSVHMKDVFKDVFEK